MIGEAAGADVRVRDGGVLFAAAARPAATLAGVTIYRTSAEQAAALLHAVVRWRPLDVWNANLGWAAAATHLQRDGCILAMPPKERMRLTEELMAGAADSVPEIARRLAAFID